ncbi:hypothetical protein [Janthinobacterium sp. P210006]|uniref:hypothetical protein n=1 Tax=Janthinobacterium sp. P210006 TaxID=3112939 RepID=UPI002E2707EB|nr:hypothetical protein [Janthinobacterium sp. P210006]
MLRFYHAILRVILRGGRKPHGRAIPIWQTRQSSNCITWPAGNMENTASPAMLRIGKKMAPQKQKSCPWQLDC